MVCEIYTWLATVLSRLSGELQPPEVLAGQIRNV